MSELKRMSLDKVVQVRRYMAKIAIATQDAFGSTEPLNGLLSADSVS